jgi:hypothetical protein
MNRLLVLCMLLIPCFVLAADAPSVELLEFLGDWETAEGEWQDPVEFMQDFEAVSAEAEEVNVEEAEDGQ